MIKSGEVKAGINSRRFRCHFGGVIRVVETAIEICVAVEISVPDGRSIFAAKCHAAQFDIIKAEVETAGVRTVSLAAKARNIETIRCEGIAVNGKRCLAQRDGSADLAFHGVAATAFNAGAPVFG